jgi:glutathione S-transferase
MNQVLGILDNYAYRTLVWDIFVERVRAPAQGRAPDAQKIAAALPKAATCLVALEAIMENGAYLTGDALTLADLHAAPMIAYFRLAEEGATLLRDHPSLRSWWERIAARPSFRMVCPPPPA